MTRLALPIVLLLSTPAAAQQPGAPAAEPLVVVSGEGSVQAVPDRAWITVGAESRAAKAQEAQRLNTAAMTPILAKLKAAGVAADAIRTIAYDLQYEWDYVNNRRVPRGYVARNTVEVRVDDLDRVGDLLEIAVGSGATTLGGIRFDLKDRATLEEQALRRAVAAARSKAATIAAASGRSVDRVVRVEERGVTSAPPPVPMFRAAVAAGDAAPPVSAGQMEIRAEVVLTVTVK